ncbi:uncharacterized protein METZ01_LOCUS311567 [marine metagenome]|uniref:Uncharacterized protein n=1 Tax=marine metagenome TaxID=408172 RepID=A0A382NBY3_9ZZZZ
MITLAIIFGILIFIGVCYYINETYKANFGEGFLATTGAAFVYLSAGLYVIATFGLNEQPGELLDLWYNVYIFQTEDWISGLAYLGLILFIIGWNMNIKASTINWGTFTTFIQAIVGAATFAIMLLIILFFAASKSSKK